MSERKKHSVAELIRLAMIYAEQDRASYASCDPEHADEAMALVEEFRAYRQKRFGKTMYDTLGELTPVPLSVIMGNPPIK